MTKQRMSPRQFMRMRRPERFSDSVGTDIPLLDRSQLEYHLSTLTRRSEELAFETFARRLLERTVCPNLLPHTGPMGGGDSKVDTETYPVAEMLAMGWYVGDGNQAATERWAFAFSAKEQWKPKLKSDIAKIVDTRRGYTKAFFVSNQYISDRARSTAEDELCKKHAIDIRIFDRTWILDQVFNEQLEQLAIDELNLKITVLHEIHKGPLDTKREQDLQYIEERIAAALQEERHTPILAEDCIKAADLARNIERPRTEVDGLYLRATRMAKQFGTPYQLLQSVYEHAWTSFWWYEDYSQFIELYAEVERLATGSRNVHELELWSNLHRLLYATVSNGHFDTKAVDLSSRTAKLLTEFHRLAQERERPSTALQARTLRLLLKLLVAMHNNKQTAINRTLHELNDVVRDSASLSGYPLESLVQMLTELGDILGDIPAFENLFETIVQIAAEREGELRAGRMLLKRGAQQMDTEHWYEGIRTLGRTLGKLYKYESRAEEIRALYLCALGYEKIGLLWAARGTMLAAASIAANEWWTHNRVTSAQAACYSRLKWIELELGRVPHILSWHQLDQAARAILVEKGYDSETLFEDDIAFDATTGMLLLRADMRALHELSMLPDTLDHLNLPLSAIALKYALGHEREVPAEFLGAPESPELPIEVFRRWRDQPSASNIPPMPLLYLEQEITLASHILGCRINIVVTNQSPCIELAESLIAALEAILATSASQGTFAHEPKLFINIRLSNFAPTPFAFYIDDQDGLPSVEIGCASFSPHHLSSEELTTIQDTLFNIVVDVVARVFLVKEPELFFTKLFRDDLAAQRALGFTTSFIVVGNVLGDDPKTTLESWIKNQQAYRLNRTEPWDIEDRRASSAKGREHQFSTFADATADPPPELLDQNITSHTQIATISVIRERLWEQADWIGAGFGWSPEENLPVLGLLFRSGLVPEKIFAFWCEELGVRDDHNRLRISIIRGISKKNPSWYRIVVGSNIAGVFAKQRVTHVVSVSKSCTMTPPSNTNLNNFLAGYGTHDAYILTYGFSDQNTTIMSTKNQLFKQELFVRQAWEIGRHDPDSMGIREDDDPIIPTEQKDAPILTLLKWRRDRR